MLIVFKNGKELRVSKEVVDDVIKSIEKNLSKDKLWHQAVHTDGSTALLINVFDISFIVDEEKMKDVL